jgi:alkylated DNA nucleotide flippase Atl1
LPGQAWGRKKATVQADRLAHQPLRIWPGPAPGVGDEESTDGFDWSVIDAAIDAIPAGKWTAHGDLAEVGGTAAQPVGNYCASPSAPANAYRVLTSGGQVSACFRWTDPTDTRDVRTVLEEEGSRFDEQGAADSGLRLRAPDLRALVDEETGATGHQSLLAVHSLAHANKREAAGDTSGLQRANIPT